MNLSTFKVGSPNDPRSTERLRWGQPEAFGAPVASSLCRDTTEDSLRITEHQSQNFHFDDPNNTKQAANFQVLEGFGSQDVRLYPDFPTKGLPQTLLKGNWNPSLEGFLDTGHLIAEQAMICESGNPAPGFGLVGRTGSLFQGQHLAAGTNLMAPIFSTPKLRSSQASRTSYALHAPGNGMFSSQASSRPRLSSLHNLLDGGKIKKRVTRGKPSFAKALHLLELLKEELEPCAQLTLPISHLEELIGEELLRKARSTQSSFSITVDTCELDSCSSYSAVHSHTSTDLTSTSSNCDADVLAQEEGSVSGVSMCHSHMDDFDMETAMDPETPRAHVITKPVYQCTFVKSNGQLCGFSTKTRCDWIKHEEGEKHYAQKRYICLHCIDVVSDENGHPLCVFCFEQLPADGPIKTHYLQCEKAKRKGKHILAANRDDHFKDHLRKRHQVPNIGVEEATWIFDVHSEWPRHCGFCPERFQTWQQRTAAIALHFEEGMDISSWKATSKKSKAPRDDGPGVGHRMEEDDDDDDGPPGHGKSNGKQVRGDNDSSSSFSQSSSSVAETSEEDWSKWMGSEDFETEQRTPAEPKSRTSQLFRRAMSQNALSQPRTMRLPRVRRRGFQVPSNPFFRHWEDDNQYYDMINDIAVYNINDVYDKIAMKTGHEANISKDSVKTEDDHGSGACCSDVDSGEAKGSKSKNVEMDPMRPCASEGGDLGSRIGYESYTVANKSKSSESQLLGVPTRNKDFVGREKELEFLSKFFSPAADREESQRVCILQGLGGVGKTQVALEYVHRNSGRYDFVLWIEASTDASYVESFRLIANALGIPAEEAFGGGRNPVAQVSDWLHSANKRWAMIFDNADDLSAFGPHLPNYPHESGGAHLFTTRTGNTAFSAEATVFLGLGIDKLEITQNIIDPTNLAPATASVDSRALPPDRTSPQASFISMISADKHSDENPPDIVAHDHPIHGPLEQRDSIRALDLLLTSRSLKLYFEIFTTRLSKTPKFDMLSYVWGEDTARFLLRISRRELEITQNLASALEAPRAQSDGARVLWVDAIYTDRQSGFVHDHQMHLMTEMYSKAAHVFAWLGPEETQENSDGKCSSALQILTESSNNANGAPQNNVPIHGQPLLSLEYLLSTMYGSHASKSGSQDKILAFLALEDTTSLADLAPSESTAKMDGSRIMKNEHFLRERSTPDSSGTMRKPALGNAHVLIHETVRQFLRERTGSAFQVSRHPINYLEERRFRQFLRALYAEQSFIEFQGHRSQNIEPAFEYLDRWMFRSGHMDNLKRVQMGTIGYRARKDTYSTFLLTNLGDFLLHEELNSTFSHDQFLGHGGGANDEEIGLDTVSSTDREFGRTQFYRDQRAIVSTSQVAALCRYIIDTTWRRKCGRCGLHFDTWDERMDHIAGHFKDGPLQDSGLTRPMQYTASMHFTAAPLSYSMQRYLDDKEDGYLEVTARLGTASPTGIDTMRVDWDANNLMRLHCFYVEVVSHTQICDDLN